MAFKPVTIRISDDVNNYSLHLGGASPGKHWEFYKHYLIFIFMTPLWSKHFL